MDIYRDESISTGVEETQNGTVAAPTPSHDVSADDVSAPKTDLLHSLPFDFTAWAGWPWASLPGLSLSRLLLAHSAAYAAGTGYRLGAKADGREAARDLGRVDCSGYVGWLLFQGTGGLVDWCGRGTYHLQKRADGFRVGESGRFAAAGLGLKVSSVDSAKLGDSILRLAIWYFPAGIGHCALVYNGKTLESHGGKGVNSRAWTGADWQGRARVWVLSPPPLAGVGMVGGAGRGEA